MEVLADHESGFEAGRFRLRAPVEEVGGVELLEHGGVADLRHAASLAPMQKEGPLRFHGAAREAREGISWPRRLLRWGCSLGRMGRWPCCEPPRRACRS